MQPIEAPMLPRGHIRILRGNLAPDGSVAKITGKEGERFAGRRKVFDSEEACWRASRRADRQGARSWCIRYEGRRAARACPRC
jgi:dihydroxy-acid dehydratase